MLLLRLCRERSDYGYSLVMRLQENGFGDLTEGSVYPALARLESRGLLEAYLERSRSGPACTYYRLTEADRTEMIRADAAWRMLVDAVATVSPRDPTEESLR